MADDHPEEGALPQTIDINYVKSAVFREAACDGVVGSRTRQNKVWMAFYTERLPLPRVIRHKIIPGEQPDEYRIDPDTPGTTVDSRAGIIRMVEMGVALSVPAAEQLHEWLGKQLAELKKGTIASSGQGPVVAERHPEA